MLKYVAYLYLIILNMCYMFISISYAICELRLVFYIFLLTVGTAILNTTEPVVLKLGSEQIGFNRSAVYWDFDADG